MRSQYMRTAFQIPFDATVRISLDTNLTMVYERDEGVENRDRWYRDPSVQIPGTEITRFPHAVLEVKLEIADGNTKPQWVDDMLNSVGADSGWWVVGGGYGYGSEYGYG